MHGTMRSSADLGLLIQSIRTREGLSQVDLSNKLGVTQRYLSEVETGKPKILNEKLFTMLDMLGIELSFKENND